MIKFKLIHSISNEEIDIVKNIFEYSFIKEERYNFFDLFKRDRDIFKFEIVFNESSIIGFISYFIFDDFIFIEHFAVSKDYRNFGFGTKILNKLLTKFANKQVLLEVELLNTENSIKRINFYKKHNFCICNNEYIQPNYESKELIVPMKIMSRFSLKKEEFELFIKKIYSQVYGI